MGKQIWNHSIFRLLLLTGAVYFFLKFIAPLAAPFLLALIFVSMLGPALKKVQQKTHFPRQVGVCLLLVIGVGILAFLAWILLSWLLSSLPNLMGNLGSVEEAMRRMVDAVCDFLNDYFQMNIFYLKETLLSDITEGVRYFEERLMPGVLSRSWNYLKGLASLGAFLVVFVIASVLLAKDYDSLMNRLLEREDCVLPLLITCRVVRYLTTFVKAQLTIMSLIGGVLALSLWITGVKNGILWGILAGVLDALPFVGTGVVLLPLSISLFVRKQALAGMVCIILYVVCIIIREFLEPKLIGKQMGVPPVAILVSIYAGVKLFGVWGILAGPLGFMIVYETNRSLERMKDGGTDLSL